LDLGGLEAHLCVSRYTRSRQRFTLDRAHQRFCLVLGQSFRDDFAIWRDRCPFAASERHINVLRHRFLLSLYGLKESANGFATSIDRYPYSPLPPIPGFVAHLSRDRFGVLEIIGFCVIIGISLWKAFSSYVIAGHRSFSVRGVIHLRLTDGNIATIFGAPTEKTHVRRKIS
jgi:hypothetical protein